MSNEQTLSVELVTSWTRCHAPFLKFIWVDVARVEVAARLRVNVVSCYAFLAFNNRICHASKRNQCSTVTSMHFLDGEGSRTFLLPAERHY
jgi:hypothetical protein